MQQNDKSTDTERPFYDDFRQVKEILQSIRSLTNSDTDVMWSRYNNVDEFITDLDEDIKKINTCDFEALQKINGEFAPTSTYNEISFSNGWGQEYINLSARFDRIYQKIAKDDV